MLTTGNDFEHGDCVQHPSFSTSGVPGTTTTREAVFAPRNATTTQASSKQLGKRKRSRGRGDVQPSPGETNINPPRSMETTPRRFGEDDMTMADRAISDSQLVRGTSDVPLPPRGRRQESRNTNERPGSSSARADEEPGMSLETADREPGSSDARVTEDGLIPTESDISGTQLFPNLGKHLSVFARAGHNPPTKGLYFRGAWRNAVRLYRASNDQYKQLFAEAGFGDFLSIDPVDLPQGYLIALTERWFSETNTLHLPCGELGATPLDWTMITGLHFGGQPIELNPDYKKEKVQELLGLGRKNIFSGNKICLSKIQPNEAEVTNVPPTREAMETIFRRLFLYVIGSCLLGNSRSVIHYELVQFLEDIDAVGTYDWGSMTYAAFLAGLRRKATRQLGAFTGFWQFLAFWAFEYLNICRPEQAEEDEYGDVFPRSKRWIFEENPGTLDNSELTASRFQLDYVDDEAQVTWQPYLDTERYGDVEFSIALAKSRVRFLSLDSWEYYLGERCRRQLGLPCLVPHEPPNKMHQLIDNKPDNKREDHHTNIERPYEDEGQINSGISAETLVRNDIDYASWFANNSIGKIVDVTPLIGGLDIGRKVVGHWMAKYQPGVILVPGSEVKEITKALDNAEAERDKLLEEFLQS